MPRLRTWSATSSTTGCPTSDVYSQYLLRGICGKLLARGGDAAEGIALAESGVAETRDSDDIEGQADALIFVAEAHLASAAQPRAAPRTSDAGAGDGSHSHLAAARVPAAG